MEKNKTLPPFLDGSASNPALAPAAEARRHIVRLRSREAVEAGLCGILCRLETVADTPVSSFPQRFVKGKSALSGIGAQSPGAGRIPIFRSRQMELWQRRREKFAPGDHPCRGHCV
jgi:hypothetical protein